MLTSHALLVPSVPTMLIDEQRGDVTEMIETLDAAGRDLAAESPAAIVIVTPRWLSPGAFQADDAAQHHSVIDLPGFGVEPRHDCPGHPTLARAIVEQATQDGVRAATSRRGADTGVSIPLHFLSRARRTPVVPLSIGELSREDHRAWGASVRRALEAWPERVVFMVSGALSWNLHAFNLRRDVLECHELDAAALEAMQAPDWDAIEEAVGRLGEKAAPEAGLRHLDVMRGFLLADTARGRLLEYETSPGIGTALVEFPLAPED